MTATALLTLLRRDLAAVRREIEAYPDDAAPWHPVPGLPNTGGTLALHVAGNLRHFIGAILGGDGYVRDRDAEFARRDVPRAELVAGLNAADAAIERALLALPDAAWGAPYPELIAKRRVGTTQFLLHLATHLSYHLGQLDYHRRIVTGDARGVDAVSVRELPETA
jgi:hypothetical protein